MADTKTSGLTHISGGTLATGDMFPVADASDLTVSYHATAADINTFVKAQMFGSITGVVRSDAGTLAADSDVTDIVTAADDTTAGKIEIAIQSEMETGTDTTRAVVPGRQHFHPSAAKFWVYWTGNSTTMLASYNMTSIANTGTGDADGTIATDFADANWCGMVCTSDSTANGWDADSIQSCGFNARAAGTFGVLCGFMIDGGTAVGALVHPQQWQAVGWGDFA